MNILKIITGKDSLPYKWQATTQFPDAGSFSRRLTIARDEKAVSLPDFLSFLGQGLLWKKTAIIRLKHKIVPYNLGYIFKKNGKEYAKIYTQSMTGEVGVTIGDDTARFFAIDPQTQEFLELEKIEITTKKEIKKRGIPFI